MPQRLPPFTAPFGSAPGVANGAAPPVRVGAEPGGPDAADPDWGDDLDPGWVEELAGAQSDHWPREGGGAQPDADGLPPGPLEYREEDIHWFASPEGFGDCMRFGYAHTDPQCPVWIFRAIDENTGRHVDLIGSWQGMFDLSVFLGDRIQGFMCAAKHVRGPQPVRGPATRTGR